MNKVHLSVLSGLSFMGACLTQPAIAQAHDHSQQHGTSDTGPWSQADAYFDPDAMAASRAHVLHHHGGETTGMVMLDRLEVQFADGEEVGVWDGSAWYGGDLNKFYLKTEGEYVPDEEIFEDAEVQLLWSRAVSAFFDAQAGIRYDMEPDGLAHAVVGVQGLAPYWFELDSAAYLSEAGDLTADVEAEYDLLLTQRLILQPRAQIGVSAQDIPKRELGAGVTDIEVGLRLRYEIKREFAPYIGVEYHSAFGGTGDFIEAAGGSRDDTVWVIGLRSWY